MHRSIPAILVAGLLAACAGDHPDAAASPRRDTGFHVLDNQRGGVGVTTQPVPTR